MDNEVQAIKDSTLTMIFEVDQAASGLNSISDLVITYMDSKPKGVKYDNTIYDAFWVIEQLTNHQRYMLERITKRVEKIKDIDPLSNEADGELSFSASMLEINKNEVHPPL